MKKKTIIIFAVIVILIAIGFIIYYFYSKKKVADTQKQAEILNPVSVPIPIPTAPLVVNQAPVDTCTPFSQSDWNKAKAGIELSCAKLLLIPIIGAKKYNDCVNAGVSQLPNVVNC